MNEVFETFTPGETPVFQFDDLDAVIASRQSNNGEFALHLVLVERGASAAVIETIGNRDELEAQEANAPDGMDFVQHQIFVLINRDHAVWTIHNQTIRESKFTSIIQTMIDARIGAEGNVDFQFQAQLDRETVRDLFRSGIESIDLGIGDFRSEIERAASGDRLVPGSIADIIGQAETDEELEAAQKVRANLSIKPGRAWRNERVRALMGEIAEKALNDYGDEIAIQTKSGLRLTRDKLTVRKMFSVDGNKQILPTLQVFAELRQVYNHLTEEGVID